MNKKMTIILLGIGVLIVLVFAIVYHKADRQVPIDSNTALAPEIRQQIIASKLKIYDIVASKNPVEVKKMMLDFAAYALQESKDELLRIKDGARAEDIQYAKEDIEIAQRGLDAIQNTVDAKVLAESIYSTYIAQYGPRTAFEKDLNDSKTVFTMDSPTRITITLPDKRSGANLDIRTLQVYLVDGKWR